MRLVYDSTFDHDAETLDQAEELAMKEALLMLGETANRLRSKERIAHNLSFRNAYSTRFH